jgi:hypothetical protein
MVWPSRLQRATSVYDFRRVVKPGSVCGRESAQGANSSGGDGAPATLCVVPRQSPNETLRAQRTPVDRPDGTGTMKVAQGPSE